MEILNAMFKNKKYVANKKERKVTDKYDVIELHEHKGVIIAVCRNHGGFPIKRKIYIWDKATEKALDYGNVQSYAKMDNGMFVLKVDGELVLYDDNGEYIRRDITYYLKCNGTDLYIIKIEDKYYFATTEFNILAGPFLSAKEFDHYGYATVQKDNEYFTLLTKGLKEVFDVIQCEELKALSKDFFLIRKNGKYGVIDKEKREIIPAIYDRIQCKGNNHFELLYNKKFGLADIKGNIIFECLYDEIMETPDKFVVKDFARIESSKTLETKK